MEQIKDMIAQIIENGYGYVVDEDNGMNKSVYFAVVDGEDEFPDYGKLSGQKLKSQKKHEPEHILNIMKTHILKIFSKKNERVPHDPKKRNQADFALWKPAKAGEPSWDSPWGRGRPGWHIECSAMSAHHLGFKFDIHGGGDDLKFPHHENEIAQSRAACQDSKVGYWLHNGRLNNDKGVKMSKSLGNYKTIREVTESYHPLALRYFFLTAHYRSPLNFDVSQLLRASDALYYIYQSLQDCEDALSASGEGKQGIQEEDTGTESNSKTYQLSQEVEKCISNLKKDFVAKMSDDLNTSQILTGHAFQDALRTINKNIRSLKNKQTPSAIWSLVEIVKEVRKVLEILGLLSPLAYSEVLQQFKEYALKRAKISEDDLLRSIEDRAAFNKNKEYEKGDQIREDMRKKGIEIMDEGGKTIWRPRVPLQQEKQLTEVHKSTSLDLMFGIALYFVNRFTYLLQKLF